MAERDESTDITSLQHLIVVLPILASLCDHKKLLQQAFFFTVGVVCMGNKRGRAERREEGNRYSSFERVVSTVG